MTRRVFADTAWNSKPHICYDPTEDESLKTDDLTWLTGGYNNETMIKRIFLDTADRMTLLNFYDLNTIDWILKIVDEERRCRDSRLYQQWQKYMKYLSGDTNGISRSTIRRWQGGSHPLKNLKIPKVNENFLWGLGGLIGDGTALIYKHKKKKIDMFVVLLKVKDIDFAINLANSFQQIGFTTCFYYEKSSERYITKVYSLLMFGILKAIRKYTELALKLLVRPLLLNNSFKCALLRGLADAEGSVEIDEERCYKFDVYAVTNKNWNIIEFAYNLLNELGINCSITKKDEDCYGVRVSNKDIVDFATKIGFSIKRKSEQLQRIIQNKK